MTEFEEAKAFLLKDESGTNLFDHISDVLLKVLTERPNDAVAIFEQLSASVKQERFTPGGAESPLHANSDRVARYCKSIARLHAAQGEDETKDEEAPEGEEPLPAARPEVVADLEAQVPAWSAAGVAIDAGDLFKLELALARLAGADESIETLKLWGKLLGRSGDYYVAEGTGGSAVAEDEEKEAPEAEANKHTYWVCSYPGGQWTQLPAVRPEGIRCARQIRRFLSGNLDASVLGYPAFPGTERDFVRTLIALVNADCAVAPKGYFVVSEEGDSVDVDEEYSMPPAADLADPTAWETYGQAFSSLGRVTPLVSEDEEGNEVSKPEGWETQFLREVDPEGWAVRRYPETLPDGKGAKVILRSQRFPGAFAVACPSTRSWANIYVGYGCAAASEEYTPPMPPAIQKEFDASGLKEQADVTEDPSPPEEAEQEE